MEPAYHRPHDKHPGADVRPILRKLRCQHPGLHRGHTRGHLPSHAEADPNDKEDVGDPTPGDGDPAEVPRRQAEAVPGDHAPLQGKGRQPPGVSWPNVHPNANLDWPLPGHNPDPPGPSGKVGEPVSEALPLASPGQRGHTPGQQLPLAGPGRATSLYPTGPGGNIHVGRSEDVNHPARGPKAGTDHPDDAVAHANDADVLLLFAAQRALSVLGGLKRDSNGDSILCCRLGEPSPHPPGRAKRSALSSPAGEGERRRWKRRRK